jgi:D-alanyl-D-alanine carboxypeptidase
MTAKTFPSLLALTGFVLVSILGLILGCFFLGCSKTRTEIIPPETEIPALEAEPREEELPDLADTITRYFRQVEAAGGGAGLPDLPDRDAFIEDFWRWSLGEAGLPEETARKTAAAAVEGPAFIMDMLAAVQGDPFLHLLVDKKHPLRKDYAPDDLAELSGGSYGVTRGGLMLRKEAVAALEEMAAAARAEGVTLTAGSAYRSYEYQADLYARNVEELGQEEADRESARPGCSQHQLGLVVDFSPINDSFARTAAGQWVLKNSGRFGWSISFPDGYEEATGYRWESWHYRYVGRELAWFIDTYFDGIQQYALQFIYAWEEEEGVSNDDP